MSTSTILTVLVLCAALLLMGGVLLILAVVVLWFALGSGVEEYEEVPALVPSPPVERAPRAPAAPGPSPLQPMAPPPVPERAAVGLDIEDDGGKTEVFTRGSLNLDWDDEHVEGEATEIFRADVHGGLGNDFKMD